MELSPAYQDLVHQHGGARSWEVLDALNPMFLSWRSSGVTFHEAMSSIIAGLLAAAERYSRSPGEYLKMVETLTDEAAAGVILAGFLWHMPSEAVAGEARVLPRTIRAYAFPEASPQL
ncbi:hypothetical protein [Kocuria sp.]|uniref:hypothetical protein n=1 Tax=Kocuria sp. TaxID=1871328 RepID=UPI0028AC44DC|nr:hypothetical protein [Kocuria sp.]